MSFADIVEKCGCDHVGFGDTCGYHGERGVIPVPLVRMVLGEETRRRGIVEPIGHRRPL